MNNRAVIYVRISSEHQGEKSSPAEQEADCRQLAADKGLVIVNVYREIEKYRVRTILVEPSERFFGHTKTLSASSIFVNVRRTLNSSNKENTVII